MLISKRFFYILFIILVVLSACSTSNEKSTNNNNNDDGRGISSDSIPLEELNFHIELIKDQRPSLSFEPYPSMNNVALSMQGALPMLTPLYRDSFRMIFVEKIATSEITEATFEIANTSTTPITISDENLYFDLSDFNDSESVISSIIDSPITIDPNDSKKVTVSTEAESVNTIYLNYDNLHLPFFLTDSPREFISDSTPLRTSSMPQATRMGAIVGDGKIKYQITEVLLTNNKTLGSIRLNEEGTIILLKLRVANTTDETLIMDYFSLCSSVIEENEITCKQEIDVAELEYLEVDTLPTSIEPNTIVEGYVPAAIYDPIQVSILSIKNNISDIDAYHIGTLAPAN
ncbi:hypothetical protein QA612_04550 [Evansella sp. AB-P1]|uniref:hypothetical protein n=1 Tax=Evansella sp. AB-P1 TaxID=3037653 RepID=UPI00241E2547|nr:hypothetical protein [Evansella sp. AB-P1]MDG5786751.1 hypothetical protein [Evansella sp. AB-P1]